MADNNRNKYGEYNTLQGKRLADDSYKASRDVINSARKGVADAKKQADRDLKRTYKEMKKLQDQVNQGLEVNVNELEKQANALRSAKSQMEAYGSSLSSMGIKITGSAEDVLDVLEKTIQRTDTMIRQNSDAAKAMFESQSKISARLRQGLKSNLTNSENIWKSYEKSFFSSSKKYYADRLEEEQRSMADRIQWMEEYRNENYSRMSDAEKEFYDTEFQMYKRRSEEIESLIKVAGADISSSFQAQLRSIADNVRDMALVSAAREALTEGMDSYIENKHQVLSRTGANFDYGSYRDRINNASLKSNILSRAEYSEIYSDLIKDTRMQKMNEVAYFAQDMAEQFKAYGVSPATYDRLMWADKNSGMQNQSYHKISNIAASLEDNQNLYVDATRLLSSINDQIDTISYLQYEDQKTYEGMYKSLSVIEALNESSAMKGTEDLTNAIKDMGNNRWDMLDSDFAKQFAQFSGAGSVQGLADRMEAGEIGDLLIAYQNFFKEMDDATLYSYVKGGKTPWSSFAAAKEFTNDTLDVYIPEIEKSITEAMNTTGSLTGGKADEANTIWDKMKNTLSGIFGRFTDPLGEFDVKAINLAAAITVLRGSVDTFRDVRTMFSKLKGTSFWSKITTSAFGKGMGNFFTGVRAGSGQALSTVPSLLSEGFASLSGNLGALLGPVALIAALVGTLAIAKKLSDKSSDITAERYRDVNFKGKDRKLRGGKTQETNFKIDDLQKNYKETKANDLYAGSIDSEDTMAKLALMGWVELTDTDGNGVLDDETKWRGLVYDPSTMGIYIPQGMDNVQQNPDVAKSWEVYDIANGYIIDPISGQTDRKTSAPGYAKGLSRVPHNGLAYLHEGEAIIPKKQAIRARADGGLNTLSSDFEENTTQDLYSMIFILRGMKDILEETYLSDQEFYKEDKKYKKKGVFSGGSSSGLFSSSRGLGGVVNKVKAKFAGGSGNAGGSVAPLVSGSDAESRIWNFLAGKGLSSVAIAGLMGNLSAESGLLSNNLQNSANKSLGLTDAEYTSLVDSGEYGNFASDSKGYGIAQWTSSGRKKGLFDMATSRGTSISDLDTQLDFLWYELNNGYKSSVLDPLMSAQSIEDASNIVLHNFEKPLNQSASVEAARASNGYDFYNRLNGSVVIPQAGVTDFNTTTGSSESDNSDVVDSVKSMTAAILTKMDAITGVINKTAKRNGVQFNSDMSYVYSR